MPMSYPPRISMHGAGCCCAGEPQLTHRGCCLHQVPVCCAAPGSSSSSSGPIVARAAPPPSHGGKAALVDRLLAAKDASGKSYSQIAAELGLTNVYTAQLFHHQQQLQPGTAKALAAVVPGLTDDDLTAMMAAPMRNFDPDVLQVRALLCVSGWQHDTGSGSRAQDSAALWVLGVCVLGSVALTLSALAPTCWHAMTAHLPPPPKPGASRVPAV